MLVVLAVVLVVVVAVGGAEAVRRICLRQLQHPASPVSPAELGAMPEPVAVGAEAD